MRDSDATVLLPMVLGTLVWLVILVMLLAQRTSLDTAGNGWWIQVAIVGVVTGVIALIFLGWRAGRLRSRAETK